MRRDGRKRKLQKRNLIMEEKKKGKEVLLRVLKRKHCHSNESKERVSLVEWKEEHRHNINP